MSASKKEDITIEKPSRGSHWKAKKPGYRTFPIPAHNGKKTEISDRYLEGFCRNFEIDLEDFKKKL